MFVVFALTTILQNLHIGILLFSFDSDNNKRRIKRIPELNAFYDPLQYTFFHPMGEPGYHQRILKGIGDGGRKFVTPKSYYSFLLQIRKNMDINMN